MLLGACNTEAIVFALLVWWMDGLRLVVISYTNSIAFCSQLVYPDTVW